MVTFAYFYFPALLYNSMVFCVTFKIKNTQIHTPKKSCHQFKGNISDGRLMGNTGLNGFVTQ